MGKGLVGAVAAPVSGGLDLFSSAMEGLDASKESLLGRPRAGTMLERCRLPRTIGGDFRLLPFIRDGSEREVILSSMCLFVFILRELALVPFHPEPWMQDTNRARHYNCCGLVLSFVWDVIGHGCTETIQAVNQGRGRPAGREVQWWQEQEQEPP